MVSKKRVDELRHKSRRLSIKEGALSTVKASFCDSYVTPFAIAINSSNFLIGMLTSISGLLGPISQWFSSRLIEKYSRKSIVVKSVFFEALMWIPMILIAFLYSSGIMTSTLPLFFLIFFSFYVIIANIPGPAWFSWIGDLVDDNYRGKWFSKRNFIIGIVGLVSTFLAAFFLDLLGSIGKEIYGFIVLFSLGIVARLISRELFKESYEPKLKLEKDYYFSIWTFVKKAPFNNFGRYTIFRSIMNLSVAIASPFFAVYMLRELNFGYVTYMTIILSQSLFGLFTMKFWGKFADRYGNYTVMKITFFFISIYPLFWLVSRNVFYLIFVSELIGGIAWAGFNLAGGNFVYDCVTPQKRGLVVSYFNLLNGLGVFIGAGLGAVLIKTLNISFMNTILFIFIISAVARLLCGIFMIPYVKEVRNIEHFDSSRALRSVIPLRRMHNIFGGAYELLVHKKFNWRK